MCVCHDWINVIFHSPGKQPSAVFFHPTEVPFVMFLPRLAHIQALIGLSLHPHMDKRDNVEMSMRYSNQHTIHHHCCCHHCRMQNLRQAVSFSVFPYPRISHQMRLYKTNNLCDCFCAHTRAHMHTHILKSRANVCFFYKHVHTHINNTLSPTPDSNHKLSHNFDLKNSPRPKSRPEPKLGLNLDPTLTLASKVTDTTQRLCGFVISAPVWMTLDGMFGSWPSPCGFHTVI